MPEQKISIGEIVDSAVRDVTLRTANLRLQRTPEAFRPSRDVCSLSVEVWGHPGVLLVCHAGYRLLEKIAEQMKHAPPAGEEDVAVYAKEYFNILCGHVVAGLNRLSHGKDRFGVPAFSRGIHPDFRGKVPFLEFCYRSREGDVRIWGIACTEDVDKEIKDMVKRIMVVDDSRFIYEEMKRILEGTSFEIVSYCKDGERALEEYEIHKPDAVTMDIILPGEDGLETTKKLLEKWPDAKVVMVTSLAYDDTMESAKAIGAADFIFKPFEKNQMLDVLHKVTGMEP